MAYLAWLSTMPDYAGKSLRFARFQLASVRKDAFIPRLKGPGFSGIAL
jgi:hypothetical protein